MPRSVLVVSDDPNLFDRAKATLLADDRFIEADGELHCDGSLAPLTNIYPVVLSPAEWSGWQPDDRQMPDPRSMSVLIFECRSPTWVAQVGMLLAAGLDKPVWFVDSADKAWPAAHIDPDRIALA